LKVIVGLGNPGRAYERTRHNVGWWAVDHLADGWRVDGWRRDGVSVVAAARVEGHDVRLVKPQTYMNLSGAALRPFRRREGWSAATDLLVIVDDIALPLGTWRLRASGSAGGHNGLKSIEGELGSREYARLRIGIRPVDDQRTVGDLADFVLRPFGHEERDTITALLPRIGDIADTWLHEGILPAMNRHNATSLKKGEQDMNGETA
jgi:PTH1 family peptidyl-tRNA hydrolase